MKSEVEVHRKISRAKTKHREDSAPIQCQNNVKISNPKPKLKITTEKKGWEEEQTVQR